MLRITMLKLKKAWSIALTLRNRGDTRFHRLMMVRTAQKSTNTDKDNEWKCKQIIDYLFSPLRTHSEIRRIQSIIISDIKRLQKAIDKKKAKEHHEKPECIICPKAQREKCNKLIAEIFGDQKFLDSGQVSKAPKEVETVFSTTAKQTEEQLAQKVEIIHETPMVEAEKPKIEELNTPPRVLGQNLQRLTNFDGETTEAKEKVRNKFKSMVRRLENSEILSKVSPISHGVINYSSDCSTQGGKSGDTGDKQDKHLIKEMQHLGVPQGSGNSILDIQINPTKKPQKPSAKTEIELEARSNDNGYSFDNQQKEGSVHNKTLHNPDFVSKLHEEGIRYTEQMSSNCKETKEDNTKKETPSDSQKTEQEKASQSTPDNKKENSTSTSQAFRLSTNQLNPWSGKYPYFSGIPINQNMYYPGGYTQQKQQYDPNQPIIDPHDKKNIASDTETYGYEPLRNDMSHYTQQNKQTEQPQTVEPQSSEQTSKADPGVIPGLHLNRNMPYFYNYNLNYLHPNQQNFSSYSEDSTASQQYTNYTTEQQNIDAALDTNKEPQKTDQTNPANQTQASDPNLTSSENILDRNRPYYYTQNYTYPGEQSNQHVLTSAEGELQKYHDAKITQQNEAVEQPKTTEQLPTAEPNTGYNNYLNRNMPYLNHYSQNSQQNEIGETQKATEQLPTTENYTYPGQQSNQNVLTSVEGEPQKYYDAKITPQNEAVEQPKTTEQLPTTEPNTGFNNYLNRNMPYLNHYAQNSQQNEIGESQKATEQLPTVDPNARYVTYLNRDMPYQNQDNQKTQQNKTIENTKTKQSETSNQNPEYNYYIKSDRPYLYNQNYTYFSQLQNKQDAWPNYKAYDPLNHNKSNVIEKSEVKEQLHTENTDKPADQPLSQENTKTHPEEIKTEMKHMKDIIPYSEIYTKPKLRVNTKGEIQLLRKPEQHGLDPNQTYVDAYTEVKATDLKSDLGASEPVTKSSKSDSKAGLEKELRNALMSGADSRGSSYYTSADANPDNIILDQHTGDPSFDQTQHSTPDSDPHQHVVNASKETASTLANPENIALIKKLGDESHNQAELNNPWTYHYQYYQQNLTNLSKDTDADNIILDQNTGDPSYDQCPQEDTLKQNTFAKVEKASDNIVPKFSNVIPQTNIWKQYLKSMDDSSITDNNPSEEQKLLQGRESESKTIERTERRPQYDAHRPLPDHSNNYENITEQQSNKSQSSVPWSYPALGSQSGIQQMFYPNTHPFQQPAGVHGQNPYYQSYTLYGKSPNQQNRADQKSRDGQTIDFYQHQQISTDKSTSGSTEKVTGMNSDQKPPILPPEMRPFITNPEGQTMQPLAGSSAGFVSLPKPKWDAGIFEKDESMPEEKVQVGAEGTISPLPELGTPLPKGEDIPLSELLRRVRQRNRQEALKLVEVDPFEGKCGTKKPPCPPPPPSCPKPKPPTRPPCPPAPPTCPRPCKPTSPPCPPPKPKHPPKSPVCPPKTTPACKCVAISLGNTIHNIFTQVCDIGKEVESFSRNFTRPEYVTKAIMTEDVEVRTRLLGNSLCTTYSSDLGVLCQRLETLALVRGFEPWVPVPSWPYPVKPKKKPFIGPKEGCKERPPPKYDDPCDPPCVAGNPCQGFPNKYRKR